MPQHPPITRSGLALPPLPDQAQQAFQQGSQVVQQGQQLLQAFPPQMTEGLTSYLPPVPGIDPGGALDILPHAIPGAGEIADKLGIPITSIPTDAQGAINAGLQVAGTLATKFLGPAVSSFLASVAPGVVSTVSSMTASLGLGQAFGTAIPGLGNLIGLAITGLVEAIKALIKLIRGRQQCEWEADCPDLKALLHGLSPLEGMPVLAAQIDRSSRAFAQRAIDEDCYLGPRKGTGSPAAQCLAFQASVFRNLFFYSRTTPEALGLPQIARLIPVYQQMPRHMWTADFSGSDPRIVPGATFTEFRSTVRDWTTREGVRAEQQGRSLSQHDVSINGFVQALGERQAYLVELDRRIRAGGSQLLSLRFQVVTELRHATAQYVYNQGPEIGAWLGTIGQWLRAVEETERARDAAVKSHYEDQTRRREAIEQLSAPEKAEALSAHERQLRQFRSDDAPAPTRAPTSAPAGPVVDPKVGAARFLGNHVLGQAMQGNADARRLSAESGKAFQARATRGEFGDMSAPLIRVNRALVFLGDYIRQAGQRGDQAAKGLVLGAAQAWRQQARMPQRSAAVAPAGPVSAPTSPVSATRRGGSLYDRLRR